MEFEDKNEEIAQGDNIDDLLDDLGIGDQSSSFEASKKDSTVFIIDCSPEMMIPFEGEEKSQIELIFDGYYNFLQRKIIANANDKVGLILYNVKNENNSINQKNIFKVHQLQGDVDAKRIKQAGLFYKEFNERFGGLSEQKVSLNYVLWEYGSAISNLKSTDYYLRLFLFTSQDNPHSIGDENRQPTIKRAQQLANKNVQIQLFPIRKTKKCSFDVRKFYQDIITFDVDQINSTVLDSSSKILDLQERLRQKQFKKRTLNRLTMKVGKEVNQEGVQKEVEIAVKIYSLYTKAKRPTAKKVQAKSNKLLQRVTKKLNAKGEPLFDGVVGTYYPLGGEKIKITKDDMNKIKSIEPPGMTLIGFKPKSLIKAYYNIRTSYFIYPDQEHIVGSSQFFDALITQLTNQNLVGIAKLVPRNNQQLRFAALFPQKQSYDEADHFQTPPGFHMIILPFAEDIVNFVGQKTIVTPQEVSSELIQITKLLINNLTISDFDFHDFENPSLQKFYSHLQAHALNEKDVVLRPDLIEPDVEGFNRCKDIIELVKETAHLDAHGPSSSYQGKKQSSYDCKQYEDSEQIYVKSKVKKENIKLESSKVEMAKKNNKDRQVKEEELLIDITLKVESLLLNGQFKQVKVVDLKKYLQNNGMDNRGTKEKLIDRILIFIEQKSSI